MYYGILLVAVCGVSFVQVGFKWRFNLMPHDTTALEFVGAALADLWVWIIGLLLVASAGLWYFSLSKIPLSVAYPMTALSYPIVLVAAALLLDEPITMMHTVGVVAICAGVCAVLFAGA
jgi:drug/metabolite transporter (DMT)-like permease